MVKNITMKTDNEIRYNLRCDSCPAIELKTDEELDKIIRRINLRDNELLEIGKPKLIILCEAFPDNDFIYDIEKPAKGGLRVNLKLELFGDISDEDFILNLRNTKIIVIDCAYCPIQLLGHGHSTEMRYAASICLKRHNIDIFDNFPDVPVVTLFPHRRGFIPAILPEIAARVIASFPFNNLNGLKSEIEKIII